MEKKVCLSKKLQLTLLLSVVVLVLLTGCSGQQLTPPATAPASAPEPEKEPLELLDFEWQEEQFARYIVGNIRNNSDRTYGYVQIEINLFDRNDVQVGSTLANVNNLAPGTTWRFRAFVLEEDAQTARVAGISGF